MICWHEVVVETPSLVIGKMQPRLVLELLDEGSTVSASVVRDGSGEALVQPQIIPPLHGDQITKPHVADLVLNDNTEEGHLRNRHFSRGAHDIIRICNTTDVLHGAIFVIWAHYMINFTERISLTKVLLIKVNSCFGNTEDKFMF